MKNSQPKSVLEQLRLQVQLDQQIAELGEELQALPEMAGAMARVGARTTTISREEERWSDPETESADIEDSQSVELSPLAKQAGVLQDALYGVLPGIGEDELEEDELESEGAPVLISRLAQGVASLERTVYSSALLCQAASVSRQALTQDHVEETSSLTVSFFHSAGCLQQVVDFLNGFSVQNPQATLDSTVRERLIQYLKEAQEKLDEFEGPDLPKMPEYTPAFFAKRHNRSENTIREHLIECSKRDKYKGKTKEIGRWCITDWDVAVAFDRYLWVNRRTKSSDAGKA